MRIERFEIKTRIKFLETDSLRNLKSFSIRSTHSYYCQSMNVSIFRKNELMKKDRLCDGWRKDKRGYLSRKIPLV